MSRWLTVLFAAAEALVVLVIGVGAPIVCATFVWAAQYGFSADWTVVWRVGADLWLLGHGVDFTFTLDAAQAAATGVAGAGGPVDVTGALLGFALLTFLLALRAGRRVAESGHPLLGIVASAATFCGGSIAVVLLSLHDAARASISQGIAFPTLVFTVGLVVGLSGAVLRDEAPNRFATALRRLGGLVPRPVAAGIDAAIRGGLAAVAGLVAVAAVVTALSIAIAFTNLIALYETLHTGIVGGAVLTIAQFSVLPNAVLWTAAYLAGPGYAVGTGSSVSAFGTLLGPIPPLPLLGAIPAETAPGAWIGLIVPLAAGLVAGLLAHRRLRGALHDWWVVLVGLGGGLVGGLALGLLTAWSGGAAGPGRLADLGPDGAQVGVWAGIEFAVSIVVGLLVRAQFEAFSARRA